MKYRLTEDRDLVGSGATGGKLVVQRRIRPKAMAVGPRREPIFQARGEILEGPQHVKSRRAPTPISR